MRLLGLGFVVLLLIVSCAPKDPLVQDIDDATGSGMRFLARSYSGFSYDDEYLKFVYDDEDLVCPVQGCTLTYRLMDGYFNVKFIEEVVDDVSPMGRQVSDADAVLKGTIPLWNKEPIFNTIKGLQDPQQGIALDTYCILGMVYDDKSVAAHVREYVQDDLNIMPDDYHAVDVWRNIGDESWCVRLFLRTEKDKRFVESMVRRHLDEAYLFIDSGADDVDKVSVVYHTLYVVADARKYLKTDIYDKDIVYFSDFLSYFADKSFFSSVLMESNMLDVLLYAGFDNDALLEEMVTRILEAQGSDGRWRMSADAPENVADVFTTMRAVVAINEYKRVKLS
ncbi:MAG: hypothetical protein ABIH41_06955 [Nanoarchaeota archaeon]